MIQLVSLLLLFTARSFSKSDCGVKSVQSRIIGGQTATPKSWPWMASIWVGPKSFRCGAALITKDWVLTSGRCVDSMDPKKLTVMLGSNDVWQGEKFQVSRVVVHPKFHKKYLYNDVALMQLSQPATLSDNVNTICLPPYGSRVSPGTKCYITGWGEIKAGNNHGSVQLQEASAPIASFGDCKKQQKYIVDKTEICAGGKGSSFCRGDHGGPLSCEENGRWYVRGVASWYSSTQCLTNHYNMFARVSAFTNWIQSIAIGCGIKSFQGRVSGGSEAAPNSWPWQAQLKAYGQQLCGGSLISEYWVLTAGHCVHRYSARSLSVHLGAHTLSDGQEYGVSKVVPYPKYRYPLYRDIALLRLNKPVTFSEKVSPICLPSHGSRVPVGKHCWITGWGKMMSNNFATKLQQSSVPVVAANVCKKKGVWFNDSTEICIGGKRSTSCNGDSGGPLSCQHEGIWYVHGASSWGRYRDCSKRTYAVYARVSPYVNWIKSVIDECF